MLMYAITVSESADQSKAYINAVQQGATNTGLGTWAGNLDSNACHFGSSDGSAFPHNGLADHIAIYDNALNLAQLQTIYNSGKVA